MGSGPKSTITSGGSYEVGDGGKYKIDFEGGGAGDDVTLVAPTGDDTVGKIEIKFGKNDNWSNKVTIDLSTFDENNLHIDVKDYDTSDEIVLQGGTITGVDPTDSSKLSFTYVGEDGNTYTGYIHIKDKGENDFTDPNPNIIICFATGAQILTDRGEIAVEDLLVGALVKTRDFGLQPVRWIGSKRLDAIYLARNPHLRPVRISAGAMGHDLPTRDLLVSPQHRMCTGGSVAQLLFGLDDMLVAAKHLVNDRTIRVEQNQQEVVYYHLLFDRHQVIFANGAPSESLFPGDMAIDALDRAAVAEIYTLFPSLQNKSQGRRQTILPVLKAHEAQVLKTYDLTT